MPTVSQSDLQIVSHLLDADEEVRWVGQPVPLRSVVGALPLTVFGAFFGGFALFWMIAASGFTVSLSGPSGLFALFGVPFFLVGLLLFLSPLWAYRKARRTIYAVTNRRVLIAQPSRGGLTSTSLWPHDLLNLEVTVRRDGSGTLSTHPALRLLNASSDSTATPPALIANIPDVLHVKRLLDALRPQDPNAPLPLLPLDDEDASDASVPDPPGWNLAPRSRP